MSDLEIVDPHHHFWNLDALHYPWLTDQPLASFPFGEYDILRRNYLPEDYWRDAEGHNVVKTVHVEADRHVGDPLDETNWLTHLHERAGVPNAIVAWAPLARPDTEEILARQADNPLVRGIRTKPKVSESPDESVAGDPGTMQDDLWLGDLALFEKYGLSWDMRVPYWHLGEAAEVARSLPGVQIILNHAGLPWDRSEKGLKSWRQGMEAVAACPNVTTKISFLLVPDSAWNDDQNARVIRDTIEAFGVDRSMFASNYPVDRMRASFDTIYSLFKRTAADFAIEDQRKLFSENAMRIYRIDA